MKTILILLVLLPYFAFSQIGESSCSNMLLLTTSEDGEEDFKFQEPIEREVPFLEAYNLQGGGYGFIFDRKIEDSTYFFYIDAIDEMELLKKKYNSSMSIPEDTCRYYGRTHLRLTRNNDTVEEFYVNWKCKKLTSSCGTIEFDPTILMELGNSCTFNKYEKKFNSFASLIETIKQFDADSSMLYYSVYTAFKGTIQFEFTDSLGRIDIMLEDDFWSEAGLDRSKVSFLSDEEFNKARKKIGRTGLFLQLEIEEQFKWDDVMVKEWKKIENKTSSYEVKVEYKERALKPVNIKKVTSDEEELTCSVIVIRKNYN